MDEEVYEKELDLLSILTYGDCYVDCTMDNVMDRLYSIASRDLDDKRKDEYDVKNAGDYLQIFNDVLKCIGMSI